MVLRCICEQYFLVFRDLAELGEHQSSQNDVKSMAITWKHISKLATDFYSIYRAVKQQNHLTDTNGSLDDLLDWITLCVENICKQIRNCVQKWPEMVTFIF